MAAKQVLLLINYYLPGFKAGGAIRTLAAMTQKLSNWIDFTIITADRDDADSQPYAFLNGSNQAIVQNNKVYYLCCQSLSFYFKLAHLIFKNRHKIIYLNSFFCFKFSILPLIIVSLLGKRAQIILAPRGELFPQALKLKKTKKAFYLKLVKWLRLYKNIHWHASTNQEADSIREQFGQNCHITIAQDLTALPPLTTTINSPASTTFKIIFLSRLTPKKNLLFALQLLAEITQYPVQFDIYGPIDDSVYWHNCQNVISKLPSNIKVNYCGILRPEQVVPTFSQYDLFLFPTLGENFAHVIAESLYAGCPVITSDQTPWQGLQNSSFGAWLALNDKKAYLRKIHEFAHYSEEAKRIARITAQQFAAKFLNEEEVISKNLALFGIIL